MLTLLNSSYEIELVNTNEVLDLLSQQDIFFLLITNYSLFFMKE